MSANSIGQAILKGKTSRIPLPDGLVKPQLKGAQQGIVGGAKGRPTRIVFDASRIPQKSTLNIKA